MATEYSVLVQWSYSLAPPLDWVRIMYLANMWTKTSQRLHQRWNVVRRGLPPSDQRWDRIRVQTRTWPHTVTHDRCGVESMLQAPQVAEGFYQLVVLGARRARLILLGEEWVSLLWIVWLNKWCEGGDSSEQEV
jgi:hypothetical protein